MNKKDQAALHNKFIQAFQLMNVYLNHYPRHERYGLALRTREAMYATYGYFIECGKRYRKRTSLTNMDISHEQWRMYLFVGYKMRYLEFKNGKRTLSQAGAERRFNAMTEKVDEIGRIIGAMIEKEYNPKG